MSVVRFPQVRAGALVALVLCATQAAADVQSIETRVTQVKGDVAVLDKGSEDGVASGQVFDVYRDGEVYFLPLTNGKVPLVRPQERVGRVEVFELDDHSAKARLIEGRAAPNQFAYLNPKAQAPNHPPEFVNVSKGVKAVDWQKSVSIKLRNTNEPDEVVRYSWSTNGGVLAAEFTTAPSNTWTAPPTAGDYQVNVTALDAAGQQAHAGILLRSRGIERNYGVKAMRPTTETFGPASLYGEDARDVAFSSEGNTRSYVLTERSLILDEALAARRSSKLPDGEFTCVAVSHPRGGEGKICLLDTEQRSVLVYRAPENAKQPVLSGKPLRLGQPGDEGNGHLSRPVDLALSPDGQMVYVLDAAQRCVQVFRDDGRFLLSFGQPGSGPNELHDPSAIAVSADGRVFVADSDPDRRAIVVFEGFLAQREVPLREATGRISGLTIDAFGKAIFALDRASGKLFSFDATDFAPGTTYKPASSFYGALRSALRLRADRLGKLWVIDREGRSVVRLDPEGRAGQWFERRTGGVEVSDMLRVAVGPRSEVAVLDDNQRVTCFDADGWIVTQFGGSGDGKGKFDSAIDLAISSQGDVFVLDAGRQELTRFSRTGVPIGGPVLSGIRQAVDLSPLSDRSGIAVVTQGGNDAFTLVDANGEELAKSQQYGGDLTPARGCVTVDEAKNYLFWHADADEELVFRAPMDGSPVELQHTFNTATFSSDVIGDMEPTVFGWVFVSDRDVEKLVVFDGKGIKRWEKVYGDQLRGLADLGSDDLGYLYAIDTSRNLVLKLSPQR